MNFRIFLALAVALSLAACSSNPTHNRMPQSELGSDRYDKIYSMCSATQGNGYNWAATMGWYSEQLFEIYNRAKFDENRGKKIGIHAACFAGGSSGSGMTVLVHALLTNDRLFKNRDAEKPGYISSERILSPDEVKVLAMAVRTISLGSDLEGAMRAGVAIRAGKEMAVEKVNGTFSTNSDGSVDVWDQAMDAKVPASDFANTAQYGQVITYNDVAQKCGKYNSSDIFTRSNNPFGSVEKLREHYKYCGNWLADDYIEERIDASIRLGMLPGTLVRIDRRKGAGVYPSAGGPESQKDPLQVYKQTMARPLGKGFMTIVLSAFYPNMATMQSELKRRRAVNYKTELRPVMLMSEGTARELVGSSVYQSMIAADRNRDQDISRYVIAVISQRFGALNPSIREPGLLGELAAPLSSDALRISHLYDPRDRSQNEVKLYPVRTTPGLSERVMFAIGGFPFREQIGWLPSVYQQAMKQTLLSHAPEIVQTFHLYGKDVIQGKPGFAEKAIAGELLAKETTAAQNLADWYRWEKAFYTQLSPNLDVYKTHYDWDSTGDLPAGISGNGYVLTVDAIAASRKVIYRKSHNRFEPQAEVIKINPKDP